MNHGGLTSRERPAAAPRRLTSMRIATALLVTVAASAVPALVAVGAAAPGAACSICGKNLIKNPGAELGRGQNAEHESGAVPGWTKTNGAFGAASYSYSGFWFSPTTLGPKDRGKNYFFGGSLNGAAFPQSVGTQTIKMPASAAGHRATLSGWLGNYGSDTAQVRAEFMSSAGTMLSAIRIGPDSTIGGTNMALRTRTATVPRGTASIAVVITFTTHDGDASQAGADDLSLVLS
jgi:hypothetical protein